MIFEAELAEALGLSPEVNERDRPRLLRLVTALVGRDAEHTRVLTALQADANKVLEQRRAADAEVQRARNEETDKAYGMLTELRQLLGTNRTWPGCLELVRKATVLAVAGEHRHNQELGLAVNRAQIAERTVERLRAEVAEWRNRALSAEAAGARLAEVVDAEQSKLSKIADIANGGQ